MADNKYKLQFTLSNGETINAGEIVAPQGPKGDKGDSADIPYSSSTPFMDGAGSAGSANAVARGDHRHPSDTTRQEKLVSGENIKTINGQSVLGSGDIPISGGGSVSLPITFSGASPGPGSGGTIISGTYTSGYPGAAMIQLEYSNYKILISPVQMQIQGSDSGKFYNLVLDTNGIVYNAGNAAYAILRQDNVKTLFGNQSIYAASGSGNIDLFIHNLVITAEASQANISEIKVLLRYPSSSNTKVETLTDLYTACSKFGEMEASGYVMTGGGLYSVYSAFCNAGDGVHYVDQPSGIAWTAMVNVIIEDTVTTV